MKLTANFSFKTFTLIHRLEIFIDHEFRMSNLTRENVDKIILRLVPAEKNP